MFLNFLPFYIGFNKETLKKKYKFFYLTPLPLRASHETIRNVLQKHKYSSRVDRKNPCCQHKISKKDNICHWIHFTSSGVVGRLSWDENNALYHDGPQRVWPLPALENKNLIPTVKFGKLFIMVWGCISSKGVDVISILDEIMNKEVYIVTKMEMVFLK